MDKLLHSIEVYGDRAYQYDGISKAMDVLGPHRIDEMVEKGALIRFIEGLQVNKNFLNVTDPNDELEVIQFACLQGIEAILKCG